MKYVQKFPVLQARKLWEWVNYVQHLQSHPEIQALDSILWFSFLGELSL